MLVVAFLLVCFDGVSQEIVAPTNGNAMVYFARINGTGALINFKYFDGDQYLGKFSGLNFAGYECEPGEHIFWVSAENRDFIKADLLPNKAYVIEVKPTMGAFKAAVKIQPLIPSDPKQMKRLNRLLDKRDVLSFDEKRDPKEAEDLSFFITNGLEKYERDVEKGVEIPMLKPEMYHE